MAGGVAERGTPEHAIEYLGASTVRQLIAEHGLRPSKSLGQNFLVDPNHVRRICEIAGASKGTRVLEIGPGLGSLTVGLLIAGAEVVAVEKDARLASILKTTADGAAVAIADALHCDLAETVIEAAGGSWPAPWRLAANLPYNVATHIFVKVLEEVPQVSGGVIMVQREVAQRLSASPGGTAYGGVSAIVAYYAETRLAGRVSPSVFVPSPRVDSALVAFERHDHPPVDADKGSLLELIRAGFSHRRKTFRNAIASLSWADAAIAACQETGIDSSRRAETMSLEEFAAITTSALEIQARNEPVSSDRASERDVT